MSAALTEAWEALAGIDRLLVTAEELAGAGLKHRLSLARRLATDWLEAHPMDVQPRVGLASGTLQVGSGEARP